MHASHPPPVLLLVLTITLLISVHQTTAAFSPDSAATFSNCNQTFSCGPLRDLTYPFTGGARPGHCGPPGFHLSCTDDDIPEFVFDSLSYRVIQVDPNNQIMTISRSDLYNNTCLNKLTNTSLNSSIFTLGLDNENVSLFYGCSLIDSYSPINLFQCNISGNSGSSAFYLYGPVPVDPVFKVIHCTVTVTVPVLTSVVEKLRSNSSSLGEAFMDGFNVNYTIPSGDECAKCLDSGGECGFSGGFVCICGNRDCNTPGSSSRLNWSLRIVIGITASFAGVVIASAVIIYRRRRRKLLPFKATIFGEQTSIDDQNVEEFTRNYGSLAPKRYRYSDVKKMTNSFSNKLGQGGYGTVYRGKLLDGQLVAVKVLGESKSNGEEFVNEVASIGRTSHVNIVSLLGFCYEKRKRALVYEFMPNGSLDKFICNQGSRKQNTNSQQLEWRMLYEIALGIARGLEYLHHGCKTRIVHFDIKPQNILLDDHFCPKISDFGLAKLCQRKGSIVSMMETRGTMGFIAPEVFCRNYGGVSHKSDVYSYGMLILDMVGGRKDIGATASNCSEMYFPDWIYKDLELDCDSELHEEMTDEEAMKRKMVLVSLWCIQTSPSDRPSMSKVVEMLEGSIDSLQGPPKPFLFQPATARASLGSWTASSSR